MIIFFATKFRPPRKPVTKFKPHFEICDKTETHLEIFPPPPAYITDFSLIGFCEELKCLNFYNFLTTEMQSTSKLVCERSFDSAGPYEGCNYLCKWGEVQSQRWGRAILELK